MKMKNSVQLYVSTILALFSSTHIAQAMMVDALPPFHNITFSAKNLNTDISLRSEILVLSPESYRKNFSIDFSLGLVIEGHKTAKTKYAKVCFITDVSECTEGAAGVGTDEGPSSSSGGPDWEIDGKEQCEQSGYDCTPCPEGQKPSGTCPFDSSCHATCVNACPVENTLTCTGPDEAGVGDACDGLYASCCKLCSDYPYDEIKAGYVLTDSCKDCDGNTHYKLKCDVWGQGSGMGTYFDCGDSGGAGGSQSCTDEETGETYYSECKCPLNQEWSSVSKACVCSTSYKYDCQGAGYATTQTGDTCDNKYSSCDCADGFEWDAESGLCACGGTDWCTLNQDCGALGYAAQTCNGKALKCPFDTNYSICL